MHSCLVNHNVIFDSMTPLQIRDLCTVLAELLLLYENNLSLNLCTINVVVPGLLSLDTILYV